MGWTAPDGIMSAKLEVSIRSSTKGPSMTKVSMIGLDLGKNAFQAHGIDAVKVVVRRQLRRRRWKSFGCAAARRGGGHGSVRRRASLGAGGSKKLGHEARIMPAAYVKPYVKRNKNDGRDAEGVRGDGSSDDAVRASEELLECQAVLVLHRTRRLLVRQRTMSGNAFRSALAELGIVAAQDWKGAAQPDGAARGPGERCSGRAPCRCGCWRAMGKRSTRISASWKPKSSSLPRPTKWHVG